MRNAYVVRLYCTCDSFRGTSDVPYSRCRNMARVDVGLSVGIGVTVSFSSNKVRVVVVFTKNVVKVRTFHIFTFAWRTERTTCKRLHQYLPSNVRRIRQRLWFITTAAKV